MPANLVLDRPVVTTPFLPSSNKTNSLPNLTSHNNNNNNHNYNEIDRSNSKKKRKGRKRMSLKEFHNREEENDIINLDEIVIAEIPSIDENSFNHIFEDDEAEEDDYLYSDFIDDEIEELACYYDEELINHKKSIKNHIFPGCKDLYGRSKRKNIDERLKGHYFIGDCKFVKGHRHRKNIRMDKFTNSPVLSLSLHPTRELIPVERDWEPIFCEEYHRIFSIIPNRNYYSYEFNSFYNNYYYEKEVKGNVPLNSYEIQLKNEIKKSKRERKQLECGLHAQNLEDILYRELTPEDYELLLILDESVPKKTIEINIIDTFPSFIYHRDDNENTNNDNHDDHNNGDENNNHNEKTFFKRIWASIFPDKNNNNNNKKKDDENDHQINDENNPTENKEINEEERMNEEEMSKVGEKCTICLCDYENEDKITKIPTCGHFFHHDCIYQWLSKSSTKCPLDGLSLID